MRIGYFDCFSGASGDMILGALVAAGLPPDSLRADLAGLKLPGWELAVTQVNRQGIAATRVEVRCASQTDHRHLRQIATIIEDSTLSAGVKAKANRVFTRLAEAEAKVHATTVDQVHFHEVGAVDAIVDIVGAVVGIERLGIVRVTCSPIPTGSGTVRCEHGVMPIPAPATAELLAGVPLAACDEPGELTTPTGAAILTTLAGAYGSLPPMRIGAVGYGAGSRENATRPNLLRLIVGETDAGADLADEVLVLEANLDDATGQQIGHAMEALFAAGALDVFTTAVMMKKGRPGVLLSVLAPPDRAPACEETLFAHTTTFGVRRHRCERRKLDRAVETVATPYGPIRVKIGRRGPTELIVAPEYDDCAQAARAHGVSLSAVTFEARRAWQARGEPRA